ncbi:hypothetical protein Tco_0919216 [Tanacetum coccineum]
MDTLPSCPTGIWDYKKYRADSDVNSGTMEREPDIENMTLNEYLEYEDKKESVTLDYLYYCKEVKIKKYYALHPLLLCFQPSKPHTKCGYGSLDESDEMDIDSMTITEYELNIAKQEDVERLRQMLTPPGDTYDAPATDPILDELLVEFGDELLDITVVDEEADCNPTKDIEELDRLLAKDPQSYFTKIQVHSVMVEFKRISLTGFHSCTSHSFDTSLVHIESLNSPTAKLFDDDSRRISIFIVNTKEYHSDVLANATRIMRKTLLQVYFYYLVIGGWSGLPPFQYQRSRNEKADRSMLISMRNETNFFCENPEYLGWVVHCIIGSMMACLLYQNHLCDYR